MLRELGCCAKRTSGRSGPIRRNRKRWSNVNSSPLASNAACGDCHTACRHCHASCRHGDAANRAAYSRRSCDHFARRNSQPHGSRLDVPRNTNPRDYDAAVYNQPDYAEPSGRFAKRLSVRNFTRLRTWHQQRHPFKSWREHESLSSRKHKWTE
jgi:hypothetical protein